MWTGARTPEELDELLEDAFLLQDRDILASLFVPGAILWTDDAPAARGDEIVARCADLWDQRRSYVADARCILQARDTALVLSATATHVLRRSDDGAWRIAICLLGSA